MTPAPAMIVGDPATTHRVARIAVVGGESSGKSTLVAALVARYGEPSVAEYGRALWESQGGRTSYEDLLLIGRRHVADEEAAVERADRCVFVDTTPLTTLWYSLDGYRRAHPDLVRLAWRRYDLVLVCAPDFAFVQDGARVSDDFRLRHDRWIRAMLTARGVAFVDLRGPVDVRVTNAMHAIDASFEAH